MEFPTFDGGGTMTDKPGRPRRCELTTLAEALRRFRETPPDGHQSQEHIRPLHWHVACRLVVEGGFRPDEVTPRPPFLIHPAEASEGVARSLTFDAEVGGGGEQTVLGGLKTKSVDVVVSKPGIGPVMAISMKGTLNAFRNLTNRMEEAVGDCTNLHLTYPALVYGFLHLIRANPEGPVAESARRYLLRDRHATVLPPNDVAITRDGTVTEGILRYARALSRLCGREGIRDPVTRYEAVALLLVDPSSSGEPPLHGAFPTMESDLHFGRFFRRLYEEYDNRFVFSAPELRRTTARLTWRADSPAFCDSRIREIHARTGGDDAPST